MKRTTFVIFLILAGVCAFAQSGVIRELSGTVELKAQGASAYTAAKAGDEVKQDTIISTGFKSTALVALGSTMITVRPLTRLTMKEIQATSGTETINVNLQAGRVRVDVNPPAGTRASVAVASPMATASVRGTSFEFDTRNLKVNHGKVSYNGKDGKLKQVDAGSTTRLDEDDNALDPIDITIAELLPQTPSGTGTQSGNPDVPNTFSSTITINLDWGWGKEVDAGY